LVQSKTTDLKLADTLRYRTELARHISAPRESNQTENTNSGENEQSLCNKEKRLRWWWDWRKVIKNPCPALNTKESQVKKDSSPAAPTSK
jgi:hypothetical protein